MAVKAVVHQLGSAKGSKESPVKVACDHGSVLFGILLDMMKTELPITVLPVMDCYFLSLQITKCLTLLIQMMSPAKLLSKH